MNINKENFKNKELENQYKETNIIKLRPYKLLINSISFALLIYGLIALKKVKEIKEYLFVDSMLIIIGIFMQIIVHFFIKSIHNIKFWH